MEMENKPGIYLRLEVGLSWPRHSTKQRSISYESAAIKERRQQTLAKAASNSRTPADHAYLQHIYNFASNSDLPSNQHNSYQQYSYAPRQSAVTRRPVPGSHSAACTQPCRCETSHTSRKHNERNLITEDASRKNRGGPSQNVRGSSAPPPLHGYPWESAPEPMTSMAAPNGPVSEAQHFKPLPATPYQFRLGDDVNAWSTWPDPADFLAVEATRRGETEGVVDQANLSNVSADRPVDDQSRGRTIEMQSLATALMTVDNGFEDQWWFQGTRYVTMAGDLISPVALQDLYSQRSPLGFGLTDTPSDNAPVTNISPLQHFQASTPGSTIVDLVSPVSDHSDGPSRMGSLACRREVTNV